jgi:hypothetical protein
MTELKRDAIIIDNNRSANQIELQDQIAQLPIENPLSLDKFLNLKDKKIVNKDEDIFTSVINHYIVVSLGKKEESSDKKELKKVDTAKALKAAKTIKM